MAIPDSLAELEAKMMAAVGDPTTPSIAFGIEQGGDSLLLGAHGLADRSNSIGATVRTPYSQASVTKPITATGVMILAERGLVDLDAPIDDYLGPSKLTGKAGDPRAATVRRIADHTAGLPLHFQFYYEDESALRPPMAETIRRYGKLISVPGERHQYSNLGYGLLEELIQNVSGKPYADFMAEEVFRPLGMEGATIGKSTGAATSYGPDGVGYPAYDFDHPGGSAAYASVKDLLTFGRFHLGHGPAILSPAFRIEMATPTATIGPLRGYGFGWGVTDRLGVRIVQHTGGMGGVRTIVRLVPELDVVIVILVNGESDLTGQWADEAVAILDPRARPLLTDERNRSKDDPVREEIPFEFSGRWSGQLETHQKALPFQLEIHTGKATSHLNGIVSALDDLRIGEGRLL